MKKFLKNSLKKLGIYGPYLKLKFKYLTPRGIGHWEPLIPEKEFYSSVKLAIEKLLENETDDSLGSYLEFGVSRGTSMSTVFHVLKELKLDQLKLIGFDSFEGMPEGSEKEGWATGQYYSTITATTKYLIDRKVDMARVHLVKGWFSDTLFEKAKKDLNITKASIIMVDCDIYSASKTSLNFCFPLIKDHAILIFDDWGWTEDAGIVGQKEAFEEILQQYPYFSTTPLLNYLPQSRVFLISRKIK